MSQMSSEANYRLNMLKQYSLVILDNSTAIANQKFGIGVLGFYGIVTIKNTHC